MRVPRYATLWQDEDGAWHVMGLNLTEGEAREVFNDWDPPAGRMVGSALMYMEPLQVKP